MHIDSSNEDFLQLIKVIRFPLICLVVMSHSLGFVFSEIRWMDFSSGNIYQFITQLLSHNLAKLAVCCFFFISGFLFFRECEFLSKKWYLNKCRNRVRTILIPYISWNILIVLATYSIETILVAIGLKDVADIEAFTMHNIVGWFIRPADFPLWYMRDLMIMVIISPLVYLFINKLKAFSSVILILLYLSPLAPRIPEMRAIFYFSIGAYFSIRGIDVMRFCRKHRFFVALLAVITVVFAATMNGDSHHELYIRIFFPFGMITFANIFDQLTKRSEHLRYKLEELASSVFFIYAAHEIYILGWTKGLLLRLFGDSLAGMYLKYFLTPVIVILVCMFLYRLIKRFFPRTLAFLCGNRSTELRPNSIRS